MSGILGAAYALYGLSVLLYFRDGHAFRSYFVFLVPVIWLMRYSRIRTTGPSRPRGYGQPAGSSQPPPGDGQPDQDTAE